MSTVSSAAAGGSAQHSAASALSGRRAIVVSTIGNALEWFDFLVYGFFVVIISKLYFPATNLTISLLATWGPRRSCGTDPAYRCRISACCLSRFHRKFLLPHSPYRH
jgi:hypothetical protein